MDKLAEAFRNFTEDVDTSRIKSYRELEQQFLKHKGISKGSSHWRPTRAQEQGLKTLWNRHQIERSLTRELFSRRYSTFAQWHMHSHTSAYRRRIASYMRKHPTATLAQARGHGRRR